MPTLLLRGCSGTYKRRGKKICTFFLALEIKKMLVRLKHHQLLTLRLFHNVIESLESFEIKVEHVQTCTNLLVVAAAAATAADEDQYDQQQHHTWGTWRGNARGIRIHHHHHQAANLCRNDNTISSSNSKSTQKLFKHSHVWNPVTLWLTYYTIIGLYRYYISTSNTDMHALNISQYRYSQSNIISMLRMANSFMTLFEVWCVEK